MAVNYERVKWQNAPETATPIDAGNLNHMDNGIVAIARELDTELPLMQEQVDAIPTTVDERIEERFGETITQEVDAWLDEHVTPGGSTIVVDSTLSIAGAAADAKATGDALATKANTSDVTALEETLLTKADASDVEALEEALVTKADAADVEALEQTVTTTEDDVASLKEDLTQSVGDLKNALMLQEETIPDTVQTITFDSAGNVSAITHTANNVAVRTDAFTFGTDTITEVRTLSTGESLTIVTNTTTLQTTVTYAAA